MNNAVVEIGHRMIDAQHNQLFTLIERLEHAFYQGKGHELLSDALVQLLNYVEEHFTAEEELMRKIDYPYLNQHKHLHAELSGQVQALVQDMDDDKPVLSVEVIHLLSSWLVEHINQADADIIKYLK